MPVRPHLRLAIVAALVAASVGSTLVGCGGAGCSGISLAALHVTVRDGAGGPEICSATVTATDGAYVTTLSPYQLPYEPGGSPCTYSGANERPGVYTIEATLDGRTATTPNVHVGSNECHVNTREIEMVLPAGS